MDEGLYAAARAIRWFIPDSIGWAAEEVDAEIAELLTKAATDGVVEARLRAVLERRAETRAFLLAVLDDAPFYRPPQVRRDASRGPSALPGYDTALGDPDRIVADKYRCPLGNDYDWYRQAVGQLVPECPEHGCLLVPDEGTLRDARASSGIPWVGGSLSGGPRLLCQRWSFGAAGCLYGSSPGWAQPT